MQLLTGETEGYYLALTAFFAFSTAAKKAVREGLRTRLGITGRGAQTHHTHICIIVQNKDLYTRQLNGGTSWLA